MRAAPGRLALPLAASLLALLGRPVPAPPQTADPEAPSRHPLYQCSRALDSAWRAVDGDDADAAAAALGTVAATPACEVLTTRAGDAFLAGRLALLQGRPTDAVTAFERALAAPHLRRGDRPTPAEIHYYDGLALEAAGDLPRALTAYARLATDFPADAHTALVLPVLRELPSDTPRARLDAALHAVDTHNYSAAERILSGIVAERLGRPVAAQDPDFQHALADALDARDALLGEAAYQLGYLWYYWIRSRNDEAIPLLAAVAQSRHERQADAAYYLARAYMRAEDYDHARQAWADFAEHHRRDHRAHEATYYQGWLYLDRGQYEQAIPGFHAYLRRYPHGERGELARWYLGWSYFRLGRFDEARAEFERMASSGGYLYAGKGLYWEGRCLQEEGRDEDAAAAFREVVHRFDLSYYAFLARQRLGLPLVEPRHLEPPPTPSQRLGELAHGSRALEGLQALLEAGNPYHVLRYYQDTRPDRRLTGADQLLVRQAAGVAYDDFAAARGHSAPARSRPPDEGSLLHWLRRYPRPFDRWVEPAAADLGIDPLWIWAHMQIESHYNPTYVSYADAEGLLQLIPRTGQNVAAALHEPYAEGMLMSPALNIRYGAWYLAALLREFGDQLPLAITAYNAGAASTARWVEANSDLPFDAFVEEIPYDQSREYLKKVVGMYAHYLVLYASDEQLAETLPRLVPERILPTVAGVIDW